MKSKNLLLGFLFLGIPMLNLVSQNGTSLSDLEIPRNPIIYNDVTNRLITYCEYSQPGNSFQDGRISMHDVYPNVNQSADDFDVPANSCMMLYSVISNHMVTAGVPINSVNIYIFEDNAGVPGSLYQQFIGVSFNAPIIGSAFGLDVREVTSTLPAALELCGGPTGKKYWLSVTTANGGNGYWEFQTANAYGLPGKLLAPDLGYTNWTNFGDHFVFKLDYVYKSQLQDTIKLCGIDSVVIASNTYNYPQVVDVWVTSSAGCDSIAPVVLIKDFGTTGTLESGRMSRHDVDPTVSQCADDFIIPANQCILVESVHANFITDNSATVSSVIVYFYDDNSGSPGNLLLQENVAAFVDNYQGNWDVNPFNEVHHVRADLTTPFQLCSGTGSNKFWISITIATGGSSFWELKTGTAIHSYSHFKAPAFGFNNWTEMIGENMVFSLDYRYKVTITPPAETNLCINYSPITLTATPTGGTFSGPGISGNQFNPANASTGLNEIIYTYIAPDGCDYTDTISINVSTCNGIDELSVLNLQAFPNPTDGICYVSGFSSMNIPFTWQIMNIAGQIMNSGNNILNSGENQISFDLTGLASGTYFLKIQTTERDQVIRIIKN